MREKIYKFTVTLKNFEDMYYREICVQRTFLIKDFCYMILASFEALANDYLFVEEASQPTIYIYDNVNINDLSIDTIEIFGERKEPNGDFFTSVITDCIEKCTRGNYGAFT